MFIKDKYISDDFVDKKYSIWLYFYFFPYFCKTPYFIYEKNYSYRRRDQRSFFY